MILEALEAFDVNGKKKNQNLTIKHHDVYSAYDTDSVQKSREEHEHRTHKTESDRWRGRAIEPFEYLLLPQTHVLQTTRRKQRYERYRQRREIQ